MPKKGGLTGGTGDVNPQWYKLFLAGTPFQNQTTLNATQTGQQTFPLPVPKWSATNGRSIVVELLKVRWYNVLSIGWTLSTAQGSFRSLTGYIATRASSTVTGLNPQFPPYQSNDPAIIDSQSNTIIMGSSATNFQTFEFDSENPVIHDLTDGAGHGVLIATDNITLAYNAFLGPFDAAIYTFQPFAQAELLYRFKEVSLQEYIGIVQSQQANVGFGQQ